MTLSKPINILIAEFISERSITGGSADTYKRILNVWVLWMIQNADIKAPSKANIITWMKSLEEAGRSQLTIESYVTVLSIFFRWMESKQYWQNIAKGVKVKRASREYRKHYIPEADMVQWLASLQTDTLNEKRNTAIINLMLNTAFRCVEISRFSVGDIRQTGNGYAIRIQRKGHKEKDQSTGIPTECVTMINDYLAMRGKVNESDPLFASHRTGRECDRLLPKSVGQIITNQLTTAKLKSKWITPHSLRHSSAVYAIKNGATEFEVKAMMGHSSPTTTARYLRMIEEETMEMNPAARCVNDYIRNGGKSTKKLIQNEKFSVSL
jgi:site-specific recombinase XerD